jgi:hypothetical protein
MMARGNDSFSARFPDGLRDRLKVQAALNRRSMAAELVLAVEHWLDRAERPTTGITAAAPVESIHPNGEQ